MRTPLVTPIALFLALSFAAPAALDAEAPAIIAVVNHIGATAGDMTFDAGTQTLYVADLATGLAHLYDTSLNYLSSVPAPAPGTVTGIAWDGTTNLLYWSVWAGGANQLWVTDAAGANPSLVALINPGGLVAGMDFDTAGTLWTNDFLTGTLTQYTIGGAPTGISCVLSTGVSYGVASRGPGFLEISADLLAAAQPTHLLALNNGTCAPLDLVGYFVFVPGLFFTSFDYGPVVGPAGSSMYIFEVNANDIYHVQVWSSFVRGDCDSNGAYNVGDAVFLLNWLFGPGPAPSCMDACDVNDLPGVNLADVLYLLANLFQNGPPPPAPFPGCGHDPTPDSTSCASDPSCP